MGSLRVFLFGLLGYLVALPALVKSQDQSGFISLDCGLPANSSYNEPNTGIHYISDAAYTSTGESGDLPFQYKNMYPRQMWRVRYFPNGTRNCYNISITRGTKYLIRAAFLYGNYDGLNMLPKFDLYLGANLWGTVTSTDAGIDIFMDIIHIPSTDNIYICLINTNQGTPFISALEFRPLANATYTTLAGSLSLFARVNFGSTNNQSYRFPYDIFDRIWTPFSYIEWTNISTPNTVAPYNVYEAPSIVMSTAVTPRNSSSSLNFSWGPDEITSQYYVYMYLAEIVRLLPNQSRVFNINLNGLHWFGPFVPTSLTTTTIYSSTTQYPTKDKNIFSLVSTQNSTLPPLINAFEVYKVIDLSDLQTDTGDVNAILSIKLTYGVNKDWQADPCFPKAYPWSGLICNNDTAPRIISLDLSSSGLTGEISPYIFNLAMLQTLDLSNNSLSGKVPDFFSNMSSLKVLKLDKNNLTGPLPPELQKRAKNGSLTLSVEDNPNLDACASDSCTQEKKKSFLVPVAASVGGFLVILIMALIILWIIKSRNKPQGQTTVSIVKKSELSSHDDSLVRRRPFTYYEVVQMTNNFARPLGEGGSGTVFLGHIDNVRVAVKLLSPLAARSYQQFQTEVKLLMKVYHGNLTSLVGYLNEESHFGLIYEYMTKGNLAQLLSERNLIVLTWEDRLRIAIDTAQGLEYLHHGCKPPIVHRDVKTTNILLTENYHAKLADFGLSKSFPKDDNKTYMSTIVAGTPGYVDPEYYTSNRLTEKSDVYSFGVVLLEIITGRPVISRTQENAHIVQRVTSMIAQGDIRIVVDPRLKVEYDANSVWKAVEIALACATDNSGNRPTMNQVVIELKDCLAIELERKKENRPLNSTDSIEMTSISMTLPSQNSPEPR